MPLALPGKILDPPLLGDTGGGRGKGMQQVQDGNDGGVKGKGRYGARGMWRMWWVRARDTSIPLPAIPVN